MRPTRHLVAVAVGVALLVGLWLLPDLAPVRAPQHGELIHGRVVGETRTGSVTPVVTVELLEGADAGSVVEAHVQGPSGALDGPVFRPGDEVIVGVSPSPDGTFYTVNDRWRIPALAWALGLFSLAVLVTGRWRGLRSLVALALTISVTIKVVLPLLVAGWPPLPVAVVAAAGIAAVTLLLTEGARRTTFAALLGTTAAVALTALIATGFTAIAQFSRLQGSEAAGLLSVLGGAQLDLGGLLLAAVIFGALGVIDDVTVTQAAAVAELRSADPLASRGALLMRAMNIGRSHVAATVNTLVLAYVGASLPLLVLFGVGGLSPLPTLSTEIVAVEVMRAMAGSIGIVAAMPLTTLFAVAMFADPTTAERA